jgi:7-cyano-7-deazaguanine synthase in queuosine biosynthesis
MRDFIMQMFATQYAVTLGDDVRTICNGVISTDSIADVGIARINTLAICEMTKEWDWQILSINVDENITGSSFSKKNEIEWTVQHNIPMERTMTCWTPVKHDDFLYHCGECYACIERQTGFKDAGYDDPTKYFNRIEGEK